MILAVKKTEQSIQLYCTYWKIRFFSFNMEHNLILKHGAHTGSPSSVSEVFYCHA